MNFQDLYQKIKNIEEGVAPVEECGMPMSSPGQQDSVTMSVNMNGNGSGGIKDLMNILKNIEQSANPVDPHPHNVDRLFGDGYENSEQGDQGAVTLDIADITQTGNDMHSKGIEAPKVNGGGNPMQEALVSRLAQMYDEIKEGKKDKEEKFDALKHVKNPTKGEKDAAKDVKRGSYADRAAMLKSAEADGRLKEAAKWRDPKHKDKLYTQDPDEDDDHYDYYHDSRPDNDPGQKHSTFDRDKRTDKLHYPYGDYQVGQKAQVGDRAKKGLLTKNSIRVVKNRINATRGDHPTPKLPK